MPEQPVAAPKPLTSGFVYHWLAWYLISLPFTITTLTDRLSRAHASSTLASVHDASGFFLLLSGIVALSQPVFALVLLSRGAPAKPSDALAYWVVLSLALVTCLALFLAVALR